MKNLTKALSNRRNQRLVALLIVAAVGFVSRGCPEAELGSGPGGEDRSAETIEALFESERSGVVVEIGGTVDRKLRDDLEGSRHQLFILRLSSGHTVLVSHNIDLAPRVPIDEGARIQLRGQYEWNDRGGVVHWTHHDPGGRRPGGWIEVDGERYR